MSSDLRCYRCGKKLQVRDRICVLQRRYQKDGRTGECVLVECYVHVCSWGCKVKLLEYETGRLVH